jgi:hypothetical protein
MFNNEGRPRRDAASDYGTYSSVSELHMKT